MKTDRKIELRYAGVDSHDRPVYEDSDGKLWKDTDPREGHEPRLYSAYKNAFDGEPDCPIHGEYTFSHGRVVWGNGRRRLDYSKKKE